MALAVDAAAFALASAVLWGMLPVSLKKGFERGGSTVQATMLIILVTLVGAWAALIAVEGAAAFRGFDRGDYAIFLVGGVIGTTLGRLSSFAGVRRLGASVSSAVQNTRPFVSMLMALVFLQETVTSLNAVGILLIVTGVVVLSLTKGGDVRGWRLRDLAFPISAAVAYSAGNVVRRYGFIVTPASTLEAIALNETAATLTLGTYLLVTRRDRLSAGNRSPLPFFVLAGVFSASGLFALFHALSLGEVTVVDPISGMATLFATLFSYFLLRDVELVTRGVVVGAMLVVVGGVAVTL